MQVLAPTTPKRVRSVQVGGPPGFPQDLHEAAVVPTISLKMSNRLIDNKKLY